MFDVVFFTELDSDIAWYILVFVVLGAGVGAFASGAVGIGGVVYVPLLTMLGVPTDVAISITLTVLFTSNFPKVYMWHKAGKIAWRRSLDFAIPAFPGAIIGSFLSRVVPGKWLRLVVSILCIISGLKILHDTVKEKREDTTEAPSPEVVEEADGDEYALVDADVKSVRSAKSVPQSLVDIEMISVHSEHTEHSEPEEPVKEVFLDKSEEKEADDSRICTDVIRVESINIQETVSEAPYDESLKSASTSWVATRSACGFFTGLFSALTGTGGNIILVPFYLSMWPKTNPHQLIGTLLPQVMTLAGTSCFASLLFGKIDLGVAGILWVIMVIVSGIGAHYGLRVNALYMKRSLVVLLILTGAASCVLVFVGHGNEGNSDTNNVNNNTLS